MKFLIFLIWEFFNNSVGIALNFFSAIDSVISMEIPLTIPLEISSVMHLFFFANSFENIWKEI